jgi:DNA-binding NarL/FixJ family response regulator
MTRSLPKPTPKSTKSKILVVDDHPIVRDGLAQLINQQPDMVCCGQADSVAATSVATAKSAPDLIVLDLRLSDGPTFELIQWLRAQSQAVRILVLSSFDQTDCVERVLRAGANGYILKSEASEVLLTAIRSVLSGSIYVSQRLSTQLLADFLTRLPANFRNGIPNLSNREFQVFEMIGAGMRTSKIAITLNLSVKTVETHREHIKHKLNLADAPALARNAADWVRKNTSIPASFGDRSIEPPQLAPGNKT